MLRFGLGLCFRYILVLLLVDPAPVLHLLLVLLYISILGPEHCVIKKGTRLNRKI